MAQVQEALGTRRPGLLHTKLASNPQLNLRQGSGVISSPVEGDVRVSPNSVPVAANGETKRRPSPRLVAE